MLKLDEAGNALAYAVLLHDCRPELLTEVPALFASQELAEEYAQDELTEYKWSVLEVVVYTR